MKKYIKYLFLIPLIPFVFIIYKFLKFWFKSTGGNDGWIAEEQPSEIWRKATVIFWRIFFTVYNGLRIVNIENRDKNLEKNCVYVANHESILDGFILACTVWHPLYIMVKKEAFEMPLKGYYLRKVCCFPVDRTRTDMVAIKTAIRHLSEGKFLGLFPEGTRNREGYVSPFKSGAIKLALKKKLPIHPIYIANSHNITPPNSIFPKPAKLTVIMLEPIDTKAELEAGKTEKDIEKMLYDRITEAGSKFMGYDVRAKS